MRKPVALCYRLNRATVCSLSTLFGSVEQVNLNWPPNKETYELVPPSERNPKFRLLKLRNGDENGDPVGTGVVMGERSIRDVKILGT